MQKAYKFMQSGRGIVVVFPEPLSDFTGDISMGYSSDGDEGYIALDGRNLIPVRDGLLDLIADASKIYVAHSDPNGYEITIQGSVAIDRLVVGKILAYAEMG